MLMICSDPGESSVWMLSDVWHSLVVIQYSSVFPGCQGADVGDVFERAPSFELLLFSLSAVVDVTSPVRDAELIVLD